MKKFIIKSTKIESSEVPEKIGISCVLNDKFNIVCSENAAGKSSTLQFIREGFFKKSKQDKGKIYFSVDSQNYIQILNENRSTPRKTVDMNGNNSENVLAPEVFTSELRFNDAFTLNLEDITKESAEFLNAIKDPSGGKVQAAKNLWKKAIDEFVGANNKPKGAIGYKELDELEQELSGFRDKEGCYQRAVNESSAIQTEVAVLKAKQSALNKILDVKKLKKEKEDCQKAFNENLYQNRDKAAEICEKISDFVQNSSELEQKKDELNITLQKSENIRTTLKSRFYLEDISEDFIRNFQTDEKTLDDIQKYNQELIRLTSKLESQEDNLKSLQGQKNNLENEKNNIKMPEEIDTETLEGIALNLTGFLGEYRTCSDKLIELQAQKKEVKGQKLNFVLFVIFAFCAVSGACFSKNIPVIASIIVSVLVLAFVFFKSLSLKRNIPVEVRMSQRAELLSRIKEEILKYDNNVQMKEDSDITTKAQTVINQIGEKIQAFKNDFNNYKTRMQDKEQSISNITNDIDRSEKNIAEAKNDIKELNEKIEKNIGEKFGNLKVTAASCKDISRNIAELKDSIQKTNKLTERINSLKTSNKDLFVTIKTFLSDCKLDSEILLMSQSDLTLKLRDDLASRNKLNNEYKIRLEKQTEELESALKLIPEAMLSELDKDNDELNAKINETENTLKIKEQELTDKKALIQNLEEVGYFEVKDVNYKFKLQVYENRVKQIFAQKMAIMLIDKAAESFYKSRPALKKAEEFLSILSDDKYTKLNIDTKTIGTELEPFKKEWKNLSQGERDMVYIALRFGFVTNYSYDYLNNTETGKYSLPFIVDEVFVNLDDRKMINLLKCLDKLSETNQVIFFTCHQTEIKELIKQSGLENRIHLTSVSRG